MSIGVMVGFALMSTGAMVGLVLLSIGVLEGLACAILQVENLGLIDYMINLVQWIQYAKTKLDCIAKNYRSFVPREKKKKQEEKVSTTNQGNTALKMFRENRNIYDLVVTSVNMLDMDAFKLLELVGLEMDLPVSSGMFGRLNSSIVSSLNGICPSVIQPGHSQTLNNLINGSRKMQLAMVNDLNVQDTRVAVGGSCNTLPVSLGSPLLLQSNTQQMKHSGAFGNQSSLSTSLLDLYSFKAKSANLEDFKGDISNVGLNNYIIVNLDYAIKQQWGDSKHDYNGNTNH
ncbi:hypothetical protein J1N35_014001 [Gossypium stocksii]|uniref:Uncharacterized protein n=1 Tax=Gossypium stocksii TaxID=47602 RepID=A0A9D3VTY9_9ROSI|nr:hypothetical protein J1N35_014001 [Gossypium stocksii]